MKYDLATDLTSDLEIVRKVKESDRYAQNLYSALCNMRWQKAEVLPILKEDLWSCTWRSAGGLIAEIQGNGSYMDWYCSGMGGIGGYDYLEDSATMEKNGYVPEGTVTDEIAKDLKRLGWYPVEWDADKIGEY